ncbi:D-glycero-beta-D-manno-heptose 1,7-bisphosphate 7-phosphatase [Candidatus Thioglobus sp.]|nr:D-glycero-beta-D-manno-heptose 1,7-bisphosphate 7-phosphatase [Candidatus Thioglobus sp.]
MTIKTIFLDRDGVINKEVGYLYRVTDFIFIQGVFDACLYFQNLNYKIIIISNQSGIARGFFNENDYLKLTEWMLGQFNNNGIKILDTFYCPHSPKSHCECRKPKPGMLIEAKNKYNISMKDSWMIGDKETDLEAANLAGITNTILVRSGHLIDESNSNSMFTIDSIRQSKEVIKT